MDPIAKLFGGAQRVKLLRFFLFNPDTVLDRDMLAKRVRTTPAVAGRELQALVRMGIVKKRSFYKEVERTRGGYTEMYKKRVPGYVLDDRFEYVETLREFLLDTLPISYDEITREIKQYGRIRAIVASGFFMHQWDRRLDLLIIGDKVNESGLSQAIHMMEAELGRELSFATLTSDDYRYRMSIQDRLLRDVFDYDHEIIFDRIEL